MTLTYPLELILQDTGDVEAEVGAKCQQTVEEQHHKAIICCENNKEWDELEELQVFLYGGRQKGTGTDKRRH